MKPNTIITSGLLAAAIGLAVVSPAAAQIHIDLGVSRHRQGFNLVSPHGSRVVDHHDHYRYVVPPSHHSQGTYYTYEDRHYYTPAAPQVVVVQRVPQPAPPPPRPVEVEFGSFRHFEELATRLESLTNQFCLDLHHNYHHNDRFNAVYREAYQVLQAAKYMHGSAHRGDRNGLRRSAESMDELIHHLGSEMRGWTRDDHRLVGPLSLAAKREEIEALIHHLMFDVGIKPDHDRDEQAPPPRGEVAPPPR